MKKLSTEPFAKKLNMIQNYIRFDFTFLLSPETSFFYSAQPNGDQI